MIESLRRFPASGVAARGEQEITYIGQNRSVVPRDRGQPDDRQGHCNGVLIMIVTRSSRLRALALAGSILLSPAIASAQAQPAGQTSTQPAPPANGSMPAGGMMEKHDAMPGMTGMPMQDDKMPAAKPPMAKKGGCCGMKKKAMAKPKAAPHRHAKPAAAKPAADKPMPMKDDM